MTGARSRHLLFRRPPHRRILLKTSLRGRPRDQRRVRTIEEHEATESCELIVIVGTDSLGVATTGDALWSERRTARPLHSTSQPARPGAESAMPQTMRTWTGACLRRRRLELNTGGHELGLCSRNDESGGTSSRRPRLESSSRPPGVFGRSRPSAAAGTSSCQARRAQHPEAARSRYRSRSEQGSGHAALDAGQQEGPVLYLLNQSSTTTCSENGSSRPPTPPEVAHQLEERAFHADAELADRRGALDGAWPNRTRTARRLRGRSHHSCRRAPGRLRRRRRAGGTRQDH